MAPPIRVSGSNSFSVYYNGDNGVGPLVSYLVLAFLIVGKLMTVHYSYQGFSMTLFQSMAFAAGYDPVAGPGSDCSAEGSSGQCVVPWAGGTKNVNSVVLVATGINFAVWSPPLSLSPNLETERPSCRS